MSVVLELAKPAYSIEYILCMEGIGWPLDESLESTFFDGHIFATADSSGVIASSLVDGDGLGTLHTTLQLPDSTGDSIDPIKLTYTSDGMRFSIIDDDDAMLSIITPQRTGNETTLSSALQWYNNSVVLTDGTSFDEADTIWIGDSEAILLGSKSGVGPHTYSGSTRAYLGTTRGRKDMRSPASSGMAWPSGTVVYSVNRFFYDRKVHLYMYVPGEGIADCVLVWAGRIRNIKNDSSAGAWSIECSGLGVDSVSKDVLSSQNWTCKSVYWQSADPLNYTSVAAASTPGHPDVFGAADLSYDTAYQYTNAPSPWALNYFYHYRTEAGGTRGARSAGSTTPQARTIGGDAYVIGSYMKVGGNVVRAVKKRIVEAGTSTVPDLRKIVTLMSRDVYENIGAIAEGTKIKFLLDNVHDSYEVNRFAKNKLVDRHPIDVALSLMTTMPDEMWIGDATGGTTTVPTFSGLGADEQWIGYALFCVEGNNKDTCREITNSTSTAITVARAFDNSPTAGTEYQIRNSIYDTLPVGYGMGIPNHRIDIASFEEIKSVYLPGATLGKFIIGDGDKLNLWELIRDNIFTPYNILVYISRLTGKITAKYIGETFQTGLIETYQELTSSKIISIGDLSYSINKPVGLIELKTRGKRSTITGVNSANLDPFNIVGSTNVIAGYEYTRLVDSLVGSTMQTIPIISEEFSSVIAASQTSTITINAGLNSIDDIESCVAEVVKKYRIHAIAPPRLELTIGIQYLLAIQSGSYVSLTLADYPTNPYATTRGLSGVNALVLSTKLDFKRGAMSLTLQLAPSLTFGKVAPAAVVTSKGADDATHNYVVVSTNVFVTDTDNDSDILYFALTQRLVLRDVYGVEQEDLGPIIGFGSAYHESAPVLGDTRIYFTATISRSIATGDYVTFDNWDGTVDDVTAMTSYSAYGNSSGALTGGASAKVYA